LLTDQLALLFTWVKVNVKATKKQKIRRNLKREYQGQASKFSTTGLKTFLENTPVPGPEGDRYLEEVFEESFWRWNSVLPYRKHFEL